MTEVLVTNSLGKFLKENEANEQLIKLITNELVYWKNILKERPQGATRAVLAHSLIDSYRIEKETKVSCKSGCSFCCYYNVEITDDEHELLKNKPIVNETGIGCPFLNTSLRICSIYEHRPASCRNHQVTSLPEKCDPALNDNIAISMVLKSEIIASAAMGLSSCRATISERIKKRDSLI